MDDEQYEKIIHMQEKRIKKLSKLLYQGANEAQEIEHDCYCMNGHEDFDPAKWVKKSLKAVIEATQPV